MINLITIETHIGHVTHHKKIMAIIKQTKSWSLVEFLKILVLTVFKTAGYRIVIS
jgi:hypothetical protein